MRARLTSTRLTFALFTEKGREIVLLYDMKGKYLKKGTQVNMLTAVLATNRKAVAVEKGGKSSLNFAIFSNRSKSG